LSTGRLPDGITTPFQYSANTPGLSVPGDPNYILFVHGWNMAPWERDAYAETAFKRLYWQGYHGKFGTFQWPTTYDYSLTQMPLSFDDGEYVALLSAAPLVSLWANQLRSYALSGNLYIMAHSHGNLVVGEALRQAAQAGLSNLVNTYAACQAAVPAESYDSNTTSSAALPFVVTNITIPGQLTAPISGNFGPNTPDIYTLWVAPGNSTPAVGTKANFYNVNDWALNLWNANEIIKPVESTQYVTGTIGNYSGNFSLWLVLSDIPGITTELSGDTVYAASPYGYNGSISGNATSTGFYKSEFYWPDISLPPTLVGPYPLFLDTANPQGNITNLPARYEILSFDAEARSLALGETSATVNGFSPQSLPSLWLGDTFNTSGNSSLNYDEHPWHSGEFRFDNMSQHNFWHSLLDPDGFNIIPP
jgi:hypothetical protein